MSDNVACLHNPWRLAADASDRIGELLTDIPGWLGYEYSSETQNELQRAAAHLRQVIPLLKQASEREARRLSEEVDRG
jgi:hypothetical protein